MIGDLMRCSSFISSINIINSRGGLVAVINVVIYNVRKKVTCKYIQYCANLSFSGPRACNILYGACKHATTMKKGWCLK